MGTHRLAGYKDVLTLVDLAGPQPATTVAAGIATATGAHLVGLAPSATVSVSAVVGAALAMDIVADLAADTEARAGTALDLFEDIARRSGVPAEGGRYRFADGEGIDLVARARVADLAVVRQDNPDAPEAGRAPAIEALLFGAGVPVLLVPFLSTGHLAHRRVAIAWDGSLPAARAVRAGLPFLKAAEAVTVIAVHGGDDALGDDLAVHLAHHGVAVTVRRTASIDGDIGATLLNEAAAAGAEMVVMGAYGHSRLREAVLGGTTRTLLGRTMLPTLMAH